MRRKALLLLVCALLIAAASVFGTLAYLTDDDAVQNTFTVGSVALQLDEADVNPDGSYVTDHDNRVQENEYHLLPGHTYIKDPTVTVKAGSDLSYVRMMVTINYSSQLDAIFAPNGVDLMTIFDGVSTDWTLYGVTEDTQTNTRTYEFRYKEPVAAPAADVELDDLFESFTVPGFITKEQLATLVTRDDEGNITSQFTIDVAAHAIQADGFGTADAAWAEFKVNP